jgi:hypothetical protein
MAQEPINHMDGNFDPAKYLINLSGKNYLQVAPRIAWFRSECPNGTIDVEPVTINETIAIFKATVRRVDSSGTVLGSSTDFGSETPQDFKDYIEKASTKAIGRALAGLGYGTIYAIELDEGERIVDSPMGRAPAHAPTPMRPANQGSPQNPQQWQGNNQQGQWQNGQQRPAQAPQGGYQNNGGGGGTGPSGYPLASDAQRRMMEARSREKQIDLAQFIAATVPGQTLDTLGKRDASTIIDALLNAPNGGGPVGGAPEYGEPQDMNSVPF